MKDKMAYVELIWSSIEAAHRAYIKTVSKRAAVEMLIGLLLKGAMERAMRQKEIEASRKRRRAILKRRDAGGAG